MCIYIYMHTDGIFTYTRQQPVVWQLSFNSFRPTKKSRFDGDPWRPDASSAIVHKLEPSLGSPATPS